MNIPRSIIKRFGIVGTIGLALSAGPSWAVGLGELRVNSNLGEPLAIEVDLLDVSQRELESLEARLASRSDFLRANVDYPLISNQLQFAIDQADGKPIIKITSLDPVNETYLHFLVSANWASGQVLREYTALLDPPLYSATPVAPITAVASGTATSGQAAESVSGLGADLARQSQSLTTTPINDSFSGGVYSVKRGDNLSRIVQSLGLPSSVSNFQQMLAVFRANPNAFINNNMNLLKAGADLRIPDLQEISDVDRRLAAAEFSEQLRAFKQRSAEVQNALDSRRTQPENVIVEDASAVEPEPIVVDSNARIDNSLSEIQVPQNELVIGQDREIDASTALGGGDVPLTELSADDQLRALRARIAELDETVASSGAVSESAKDRLAQVKGQIDRVSRLVDIESRDLAILQSNAGDDANAADSPSDLTTTPIIESASNAASAVADDLNAAVAETRAVLEPETAESTAQLNAGQVIEQPNVQEQEAAALATTNDAADNAQAVVEPVATVENRTPAKTGFFDNILGFLGPVKDSVAGVFSAIGSKLWLILAAIGLLLGWLFYRRIQTRDELDELGLNSDADYKTEPDPAIEYGNNMSVAHTRIVGGLDIASKNSEMDLTVGSSMSYLSEQTATGVHEDVNDVNNSHPAVDPIAEAEVYLAYDRDEQAIQVLSDAFEASPKRHDIGEKLLEIYYKQSNRSAFDGLAAKLRPLMEHGEADEWKDVVKMGRELSPDNALYSGDGLDANSDTVMIEAGDDGLSFNIEDAVSPSAAAELNDKGKQAMMAVEENTVSVNSADDGSKLSMGLSEQDSAITAPEAITNYDAVDEEELDEMTKDLLKVDSLSLEASSESVLSTLTSNAFGDAHSTLSGVTNAPVNKKQGIDVMPSVDSNLESDSFNTIEMETEITMLDENDIEAMRSNVSRDEISELSEFLASDLILEDEKPDNTALYTDGMMDDDEDSLQDDGLSVISGLSQLDDDSISVTKTIDSLSLSADSEDRSMLSEVSVLSGLNDSGLNVSSLQMEDTQPANESNHQQAVRKFTEILEDDNQDSELSELRGGFSEQTESGPQTALDLARAYIELGDMAIAKDFIQEVLSDGDAAQKAEANKLVAKMKS